MKKLIYLFLIIFSLSILVSCGGSSNTTNSLIFEDVVVEEEVVAYKIIGYNKNLPKNIKLPETFTTTEHGKKPVTIIATGAFRASNLKSITIPENYEVIEEEAFLASYSLERVVFEDDSNLREIGDNAFKLTTSLKKITIPKSVIKIGDFAFSEAEKLTTVIFTEGSLLKSIGSNAFSHTSIKEFTIPKDLEEIKMPLFFNSKKLTDIYVDNNNMHFQSVNGVLYNKNKTVLIFYPEGKKDLKYNIIESVLIVNNHAFYNNVYLEKLILNNNIEEINSYAFGRVKLKHLIIPLSVERIKNDAFIGSLNLDLYLEHLTQPEGFQKHWNSSSLRVYFKPNWTLDQYLKPIPINS